MPPAALEPGELSSILIVEYDNDVYDNDDSDDNDNGDDNDAKLHSPLRWLTFAVRLKELTRGILDAISIRRRQGLRKLLECFGRNSVTLHHIALFFRCRVLRIDPRFFYPVRGR